MRTIEDFCNQSKGSFSDFVQKEREVLRQIEKDRKKSIGLSRKILHNSVD